MITDDFFYTTLLPLYSIGHSNVPATRIIELIQKYNVELLVDVRSSPYSQYCPQFNREAFQATLKFAGINYAYAGDALGGRPKDPACYKNKNIPEEHADFLHLVDYPAVMTKPFFRKGIQQLMGLACQKNVAIMCSEEDPALCHRHHLIGKYLLQFGVTVMHIRKDGVTVSDTQLPNLVEPLPVEQPSLF